MAAIANFIPSLLFPSTTDCPSASAPAISTTPLTSPNCLHQQGFTPPVLSLTSWDRHRDVPFVANPTLAYATTLFFKSSHYNVQITVNDHESEERLLNRFRREVMRAGVIRECKRRRFFETSQEYRKRKTREAARKRSRLGFTTRRPQVKVSRKKKKMKKETAETKRVENEEDDNWELPEGGEIPY